MGAQAIPMQLMAELSGAEFSALPQESVDISFVDWLAEAIGPAGSAPEKGAAGGSGIIPHSLTQEAEGEAPEQGTEEEAASNFAAFVAAVPVVAEVPVSGSLPVGSPGEVPLTDAAGSIVFDPGDSGVDPGPSASVAQVAPVAPFDEAGAIVGESELPDPPWNTPADKANARSATSEPPSIHRPELAEEVAATPEDAFRPTTGAERPVRPPGNGAATRASVAPTEAPGGRVEFFPPTERARQDEGATRAERGDPQSAGAMGNGVENAGGNAETAGQRYARAGQGDHPLESLPTRPAAGEAKPSGESAVPGNVRPHPHESTSAPGSGTQNASAAASEIVPGSSTLIAAAQLAHAVSAKENASGAEGGPLRQATHLSRGAEATSAFDLRATPLAVTRQLTEQARGAEWRITWNAGELGSVGLKAALREDALGAAILLESRETADALRAALPAMERSLSERDIRVQHLEVVTTAAGRFAQAGNANSQGHAQRWAPPAMNEATFHDGGGEEAQEPGQQLEVEGLARRLSIRA